MIEPNALVPLSESPTRLLSQGSQSVPSANDVTRQIQRILASRLFSKSERLCRFVRFAADHALSCHAPRLKEYLIGIEVFDRGPAYDPRIDPIVRVEARRLRAKLKAYYASVGRDDELWIEFPKGTYGPIFRFRTHQRMKFTIAVLPFENITNSASNEAFGEGLAEELIHHLAQVPGLKVIVHDEDLRANVTKWNLRGSIRDGEGRLRIIVQLIETSSGAYVWSETHDAAIGDILSTQEGIAQAVIAKFRRTFESFANQH